MGILPPSGPTSIEKLMEQILGQQQREEIPGQKRAGCTQPLVGKHASEALCCCHFLLIASQPFAQHGETMHATLEWQPLCSQPWVWPAMNSSQSRKQKRSCPVKRSCLLALEGLLWPVTSFLRHSVDSQRSGSAWLILRFFADSGRDTLSLHTIRWLERKEKTKQQNQAYTGLLSWRSLLLLFSVIKIESKWVRVSGNSHCPNSSSYTSKHIISSRNAMTKHIFHNWHFAIWSP